MDVLDRLIEILCAERGENPPKPGGERRRDYFRALCNVRPPKPVSEEFISLQDEYLSRCTRERGVADVNALNYRGNIALWQGDITRLNADAIVNACNCALLGCFQPLHGCIDNVIHSWAGVQVRLDCNDMMKGGSEPCGRVRVTKGYNLPCRYIFHTVGPQVGAGVTARNRADLVSCYSSCMEKAVEMGLGSIAFCCISTGVFGYPKREACDVAVETVLRYLKNGAPLKVIFNVFSEEDERIYASKLGI